jgi:AbrB family looped-hinge helix DNA binding protein
MSVGTITSKGQITIPKEVRDDLGLGPGARLSFLKNEEGVYELHRERRSVKDLAGSLRYDGPPKSIEEMDDAIAAAAAESMR